MQYLSFPKNYRVQNMQKFADQLDNVIPASSAYRRSRTHCCLTLRLRFEVGHIEKPCVGACSYVNAFGGVTI